MVAAATVVWCSAAVAVVATVVQQPQVAMVVTPGTVGRPGCCRYGVMAAAAALAVAVAVGRIVMRVTTVRPAVMAVMVAPVVTAGPVVGCSVLAVPVVGVEPVVAAAAVAPVRRARMG